ncbi:MAG: hypothetical protein GPJ22_20830 [Microcystis aeruginosa LL13-03]|nr:hypothetical protein [Microcystis aeruginosa LL13-03]NCR45371.1 hypothetical protein [Microcystis aeruginosa SX13-01]NCR68775.1 hypothetical protein [Microcystis aeruginosa LL11-07]NCR91279.1 hypothetical protein [Microcystis aeruginosa G13-10]NCS16648.1 hypothetical protein [Microcystis aeruginosa G13-12]NCS36003.1 hypothetical protein [Microcystis aeruginosa G11-01]NCT65156.1 hypothetical protein [Microcystis aeruginosa G13-01]
MVGIPIFLKSNDGTTFVSTRYDNNNWLLADPNATKLGDWEKFILEPLGNNKVALKSSNGNYVGAKYNVNNGQLIADTTVVGDWERFELVNAGNNRIALKSDRGHYVSLRHDQHNQLIADPNANTIQDWEKFQIGIWEEINGDGSKSYQEVFPSFDQYHLSSHFGTLAASVEIPGSCIICYLQWSIVAGLFIAIGCKGFASLTIASKSVEAIATVFGAEKNIVLRVIHAMTVIVDPLEWPGFFCKELKMCS